MPELESIRPLLADLLEALGDAQLAEFDRHYRLGRENEEGLGLDERAYRLWDGARTLAWVEDRETGPDRVLELELELEGVQSELEMEREATAEAQRDLDNTRKAVAGLAEAANEILRALEASPGGGVITSKQAGKTRIGEAYTKLGEAVSALARST